MEAELKDSKDFIEIIPNSRRMSDFTTVKEVDNFNTLKVKHYENTLDATSSNGVIPEAHQKATSPGGKSTNLTTPSPAVSEDAIPDNVPTSPQASDASVSAPGRVATTYLNWGFEKRFKSTFKNEKNGHMC